MRTNSPQHLVRGNSRKWNPGDVLLDDAVAKTPVDWKSLFGNDRPVELEIGTGKGTFLLARAPARKDLNFLGIEYARSYAAYSADRFRRAGLHNVRMLAADAVPFVTHCVPDGSLWRVHIYFPDPWPKRRHHRRRSIQKPFVRELKRVLRPGGQLLIVTDHLDYFHQIRTVLEGEDRLAVVPFPNMADEDGQIVGTNFEKKYIAQGRPFYQAARLRF
ncbi:MAG: tRNA (guanosine(46)-N7)-methyltransferase TrmB [Phycisphaerae bacterium]